MESFKMKGDDHYSVILAVIFSSVLILCVSLLISDFRSFSTFITWALTTVSSLIVCSSIITYYKPESKWRFVPLSIAMLVYLTFAVGFFVYSFNALTEGRGGIFKGVLRLLASIFIIWDCRFRIKNNLLVKPLSKEKVQQSKKRKKAKKKVQK